MDAQQFVEHEAAELVAAELKRLLEENVRLKLRCEENVRLKLRCNELKATIIAYKREQARETINHQNRTDV